MKFLTVIRNKKPEISVMVREHAVPLCEWFDDAPRSLKQIISGWDDWQPRIQNVIDSEDLVDQAIKEYVSGAPIPQPNKIICVGKNYAEHAAEMGGQAPELPVIFNKFPSAILGPDRPILLPPISDQVDFEGELVVVIGQGGRHISQASAMKHVFGYCCGIDVTARDWQKGKPGGQWLLGKTFDTFAPIGPVVTTVDEIQDVKNLDIQLKLNGQVMQKSNTKNLIFPIEFLVSHLSQFCTLQPGDLIFTGTPSGVGFARDPQVFLRPGDLLEVEIEGLGILRNSVGD